MTNLLKRGIRGVAALVAAASLAVCGGCSDEPDTELYFVGDSLGEFWDVGRACPTLRFVNLGRAGAGIAYLGELGDRVAGRDVVLLIGTNDAWRLLTEGVRPYADRYLEAAGALRARRVYLYPVLPRTLANDTDALRAAIEEFNAEIRGRLPEFGCEVVYLDVSDRFRLDGGEHIHPELSPDGIHLNAYGYQILTEALWEKLR